MLSLKCFKAQESVVSLAYVIIVCRTYIIECRFLNTCMYEYLCIYPYMCVCFISVASSADIYNNLILYKCFLIFVKI